MFAKSIPFVASTLVLYSIVSGSFVDGNSILRHTKLDNDELRFARQQLHLRPGARKVSPYLNGQFIIQLADNAINVRETVEQLIVGSGGKIKFVYDNLLKGASISNMSDISILNVLDHVSVVRASRNAKVKATAVVNQTSVTWGIDRISPPLDKVYSYQYDGTGVNAYVMDTGIRTTHTEFNNKRASCGYTAYNDNCRDGNGHGTHVAGTIGGKLYGVAKNVTLIAVKVLSNSGSGSYDAIGAGLDYVVGQKLANPTKPMVINLSLGGPKSTWVNDQIKKVVQSGIIVVVAAGNDNANACNVSPASAPDAITVGATTITDTLASYSNFGICVDILAPGSSITSSYISRSSNTVTRTISGTSMASPHTAGIVALHLSKNSTMTPTQVVDALKLDALQQVISIPTSAQLPARTETPNLLLTGTSLLL